MSPAPANPPGRQHVGPADLNAQLGTVIRVKRVLLGLSQDALGKRIGVTFQQVQKYEKGKNQVSFPMLVTLAKGLETTVQDLVVSALGDEQVSHDGLSERETLELLKRLGELKPNQLRGVRLLVQSLTEAV